MKKTRGIIWGLAALAVGVIYGGNALGIFNINLFFDGWWTLFLIVPSAISLITDREKVGNLMVLLVGVMLLLASQEVLTFENAGKVILASFLILLGISIIVKSITSNKNHKIIEAKIKAADKDSSAIQSHVAIFSGEDVSYDDEELKNIKLCAIFGGIDLDLRKAIIKEDAVIKAFCLFGGIDIRLPEDINVKTSSGFIFGGTEDSRKSAAKKSDAKKPTIYIETVGGFGGIEIKN